MEIKEYIFWKEFGGFVFELLFVKNFNGKIEDDGVVLLSVINVID